MKLLKIEINKLMAKKSTRTLLIVYLVAFIGLIGLYVFGEVNLGLSIFNQGQFQLASLSLMMSVLLPIVVIYASSNTFASEYADQSIKNMLLLPVSKTTLYLGKVLSVQVFIAALLLVQFILSSVVGLIIDGGYSLEVLALGMSRYLSAFITLGLLNLMAGMLALIINSSAVVMLVSILGYFGLNMIGYIVPRIKIILPSYLLGQYDMMFRSFTVLLSILAYYIIFYITGYLLFEKKEAMICQSE